MAQEIIGREPEIKEIEALYQTNKPVFAVVYGRRRVGKTFLKRELLGDKFAFYHTGLSPYELQGKKLKVERHEPVVKRMEEREALHLGEAYMEIGRASCRERV